MKKLLALSLVVNLLLCFVIVYNSGTVPQVAADCVDEPCTDPPCCNGDANGDAKIDLADAVSILTYLFADGAEPVAIECEECEPCYPGTTSSESCPREGRFIDHGDGTVTDRCTGLMWQKYTADINNDGHHNMFDKLRYFACNDYLRDLEFAGHDDWRLPRMNELLSLLDFVRKTAEDPLVDPILNPIMGSYWSTSYQTQSNKQWTINFWTGTLEPITPSISNHHFVRAVRDAH